jgi:type II secretory pathway component PulC
MRELRDRPREVAAVDLFETGIISVEKGSKFGMGHLGIRVINIVLFTASCFFAASVVNHVADSQLAPDYASAFQTVANTEPDRPKQRDQKAILERNLFGAKLDGSEKDVPEPEPVEEVIEEAQATKLPIELLGTMAGIPESLSSAVISNTKTKKHQVVRLGDILDGYDWVKVTEIEPRRVLLRNREIIEELLLDKNSGPTHRARKPARGKLAQKRMRNRKARSDRKSNRNKTAKASPVSVPAEGEAEDQLQKIQNALSEELIGDLKPAMNKEGGIDGVIVGNIDADSLLARAGLSPDDIITNLNGIDINSAGTISNALRELAKCQPMSGFVNGPGGSRSIEISQSLLSELNCTN